MTFLEEGQVKRGRGSDPRPQFGISAATGDLNPSRSEDCPTDRRPDSSLRGAASVRESRRNAVGRDESRLRGWPLAALLLTRPSSSDTENAARKEQ